MSHRHRSRRHAASSGTPRRADRKTLQLCGQVADTLNYVLSGELDDDVLRNFYVDSVQPAPDASRLLVAVAPLDPSDETPPDVVIRQLEFNTPRIRSAVASAISRRKTPELSFWFVRPEMPQRTDVDED
ncbi:MAG: ribosome-binding factor A [Planctomycetota bacterium]|nr:MAG: ribosome-binding factor A [Planctomycetota bacterium]REJ89444.1 MAG: ribosome-binding factor A [Planctomycetota bacterium]REK28985.1 MAG: ribosome-binding factor A [Planctomycetota bacterium]REK39581.1 MAG: ribosome-binding factor A [Planctomycetota bacterium]